MKRMIIASDIQDNNYRYVFTRDGYFIYRAIQNGKGVWRALAQNYDESEFDKYSFPISYEQARGFEPINDTDGIKKISKYVGDKLLR